MKEAIRNWYGKKIEKALKAIFVEKSIYERVFNAYQDYFIKMIFVLPFQLILVAVLFCFVGLMPQNVTVFGIMVIVVGIILMVLSFILLRIIRVLMKVLKKARIEQLALLELEPEKYQDNLVIFSQMKKINKIAAISSVIFIIVVAIFVSIWVIIGLENGRDVDSLVDESIWILFSITGVYLILIFIILIRFNMKTIVQKQKILATLELEEQKEESEKEEV